MCELAHKDDVLLTRTADIVFAGVSGAASLDHLPHPRQVFAIIYSAQGIIDNGGFQWLTRVVGRGGGGDRSGWCHQFW